LRKYGVRFGAYHIYVPPLLKPAARALASLLWALKEANVDISALSGAQHLASSGRTSFPVDKALPRDAYRVLGYRQCGERAVRVDILERLADLIRPALAWRDTSPGQKPAGAFDGRSFVVTQAMTSLTGSAGEDFASILRALGYRMDRRPPLPPKPVIEPAAIETTATTEVSPSETASEPVVEATVGETAAASDVAHEAAPALEEAAASSASLLPEIAFASEPIAAEPIAPEPVAESAPVAVEAQAETEAEAAAEVAAEPAAEAPLPAAAEAATEAAAAGEAPPTEAAAAPAEPELVEVWRPGGRSDERRPRHDRSRYRNQNRPQQGEAPVAAAGEAGEAAKGERHRRGRRDRKPEFRTARPDGPVEAGVVAVEGAPVGEPREDKGRSSRERFQPKGRENEKPKDKFGGGRDKGGREHGGRDKRDKAGRDKGRDSGPSHRQFATSASPRERDRPVDPNSPFAKLAALKEQLTANRKDR
jgi:ATP-dependent RNA helicase SUPV3L1/SUV3